MKYIIIWLQLCQYLVFNRVRSPNEIVPPFSKMETSTRVGVDLIKLKGTFQPQKIFFKYVMLRTVTKNSTIIITKYT